MFSWLACHKENQVFGDEYVFVLGMSSVVSRSTIVTLSPSLHGIAFASHNASVSRKVVAKKWA
jgi:hypothetical protein